MMQEREDLTRIAYELALDNQAEGVVFALIPIPCAFLGLTVSFYVG